LVFIDRGNYYSKVSGVLQDGFDATTITVDLYSEENPEIPPITVVLNEIHNGELKYEFSQVRVVMSDPHGTER